MTEWMTAVVTHADLADALNEAEADGWLIAHLLPCPGGVQIAACREVELPAQAGPRLTGRQRRIAAGVPRCA